MNPDVMGRKCYSSIGETQEKNPRRNKLLGLNRYLESYYTSSDKFVQDSIENIANIP